MDYTESVAWINNFNSSKGKLGLARFRELLTRLGDPDKSLHFVHIAGTNGKGSITKMSANILVEAGYKVGIFVSPYIVNIRERIQINNNEISEIDFARVCTRVRGVLDSMREVPTTFEVLTAVGLVYFAEMGCDIVCMEVGLGGKLDCTNVISTPEVAVIASIGMDHMEILGDSIEKIAADKCGIIKQNGVVVAYPNQDSVMDIIADRARVTCSEYIPVDMATLSYDRADWRACEFSYKGEVYTKRLLGQYQASNAAVAIEVASVLTRNGYKISPEHIARGIATATMPARLEVLQDSPLVILDGSHNPQGVSTVKNMLDNIKDVRKILLVGMMADKQCEEVVNSLVDSVDEVRVVDVDYYRAIPASKLYDMIEDKSKASIAGDAKSAVCESIASLNANEMLIVCGSLYLASEVREAMLKVCK